MIRDFNEMMTRVKHNASKTVVIAAAHSASALEAAVMAYDLNLARCILVGDASFINEYLHKNVPKSVSEYEVIDCGDDLAAAAITSVQLVQEGRADLIMKGVCDSGTLLKAVLDKHKGLRTNKIMSDVLAYETPEKIMLMGDGGFIPLPDINAKLSIIANCVQVAHALGNKMPKVALLTHSEMINLKNQSTVDAAILTKMNERGQIKGCIVEGPLAFDNAVSPEAARIKGIKSVVGGAADILIVPNIEAGNIFGKSLTYYCKYRVAHVVLGAKVPILIASRADSAETKMLTMALGIITCNVC
ncbi:MAG: phosphate acetyltransferase [Candidatus Cloacimonetes bacterium]|nr:phosphate acetyltransferase [Candidatus Cloacimonadota bacterium]